MFWNQYPYINLNDLNLDFLLKAIGEMKNEVTNFVSINAIKYADPIQWNITRQYEKNTIVIDPVTGTAYISVAPVPAGVALTRPEFWTVVFDLQSFVTKANQNLANNYEDQTTTTATMNTTAGAWVIWGDVLYKALVNITAGDAYVVGSNIERITIEDVINPIVQEIADEIQARQDADTALNNAIGNVDNLTTTDKTNLVAAINEVNANSNSNTTSIGDLANLNTTDKTNLVNAVNEVNTRIDNLTSGTFFNVLDYGAIGDGVTDDYNAINAALTACTDNGGGVVFFPFKSAGYHTSGTIALTDNVFIMGEGLVEIKSDASDAFTVLGVVGGIENITINQLNATGNGIHFLTASGVAWQWRFSHMRIYNCVHAIYDDSGTIYYTVDVIFSDIMVMYTKGSSIVSNRSRGFMTFRNVKVDQTYNTAVCPWASFDFKDFIGLEFEECDAVGPVSSRVAPAYTSAQYGFKIAGTVGEGKSSVWLTRCLVDTTYGNGFAIANVDFLFGSYVEVFGNLGNGIDINNCMDIEFNNFYAAQSTDNARLATANGIGFVGCSNVTFNNSILREFSNIALSVYNTVRSTFNNLHLFLNKTGYYEFGSSDYNLLSNAQIHDNTYNFEQAGAASATANAVIGTTHYASIVGAATH